MNSRELEGVKTIFKDVVFEFSKPHEKVKYVIGLGRCLRGKLSIVGEGWKVTVIPSIASTIWL